MIMYPAVDLKGGRVVRLQQGRADAETVYALDAGEPAKAFKDAGAEWVHVVDLDGAFTGEQANRTAVQRILQSGLKVELGGGIRSTETGAYWLKQGVQRLVIGTRAVTDRNFLKQCIGEFGAEHIAVGIDAKEGMVATKGWVETSQLRAVDFARSVAQIGVQFLIFTDISRDGMLDGPNLDALIEILKATDIQVIASGGVAHINDISQLHQLSSAYPNLNGVISGKAIYDGRLDLKEAIRILR